MKEYNKMDELNAITYAKGILSGISHIHNNKCVVKNLNLKNILIDMKGNPVISTFDMGEL